MSNRSIAVLIAYLSFAPGFHEQAYSDESAIRTAIRAYFDTTNASQRRDLASKIESDSDYDRSKLSGWLHAAGLFKRMEAGRHTIHSGPGEQKSLSITLRIPALYDENRAYSLIYALHGTGGNAEGIIDYVEKLLGSKIDEYVIAAPDGYQQMELKSSVPYSNEHRTALVDIRKAINIDANRQYAIGYSRGGHTCWTLAITCADEFAGIIPVAGTFIVPEYDVLFESFVPNIANTNILCCYGAKDDAGPDGGKSNDGGIAGVNRLLKKVADPLKLPLIFEEDADKGHGGIAPTAEALANILAKTRNPWPRTIAQTFRMEEQCAGYWAEPIVWVGPRWTEKPLSVEFKPGEKDWDKQTQRKALARVIRSLFGNVKVEMKEQSLRIDRKNVKGVRVWLSEPLISFDKKVVVNDGGKKVYDGTVQPDLDLCLSQAALSYDFDRLRWAGLRLMSGKKPVIMKSGSE